MIGFLTYGLIFRGQIKDTSKMKFGLFDLELMFNLRTKVFHVASKYC